ncbi:MAG TPA: hypothetical protein VLL72_02965 [Kiloniellales bacterium]|nr:hypothetical protein [Kiloniellales bacterium]
MIGALSIEWAPFFPWPVVGALAALALAVVALGLWRRARGIWWRALALAALLLALANPALVEEQRDPLDDIVMVVVDESPSQEIAPRPEQTAETREHVLSELADLPRTEIHEVQAGADAIGSEADGTRLFSALREALGKVPRQRVAGVLMLSDGRVHDVPEDLAELGIDSPIHLLRTGRDGEGDRRLTVMQAPSYGIVGRTLALSLIVEDLPDGGAGLAEVTLRRDGGNERTVQVPVGVEQEIEFELDHRGPTVLEIEAEAGPRELTLANNRAAVEVNGVRDRLRVLLVSGEPHAGERAWRNILKSDPSVDLVHFTILRPPEKQDGTPIRELSLIAFPTRELFEVKLEEFDLIIFDRYRRRGVLPSIYLDNIATFVQEGGALLEAVGPTFATPLSLYRTPLGRILPAEPSGAILEQGYRPRVTEVGRRHPVTAELSGAGGPESDPSWGRWFRQIEADTRSGNVIMSGVDSRPLLILDRVGEGRVAQFLSDHMWLWSRGFEGGGPQAELLRRIAHWLMREPDLEEENLRASISGGRLEIVRRSLSAEPPAVTVTLPSGETRQLELEPGSAGRSSASMVAPESGLYRVSDGTLSALAAVGPLNPREFEDVRATDEILRPLVEASGGTTVKLGEDGLPRLRKVSAGRDRFGRDWIGVLENDRYVVTGVEQTPLLPAFLVLLLALGAATLAWFREGR